MTPLRSVTGAALALVLLLGGCALVSPPDAPLSPPQTEVPQAGDGDPFDTPACSTAWAQGRIDRSAEDGITFEWVEDPTRYGYVPAETRVGTPWCSFVNVDERWVAGIYPNIDWDVFVADLSGSGIAVDDSGPDSPAPRNAILSTDDGEASGELFLIENASDLDQPYLHLVWYPADSWFEGN